MHSPLEGPPHGLKWLGPPWSVASWRGICAHGDNMTCSCGFATTPCNGDIAIAWGATGHGALLYKPRYNLALLCKNMFFISSDNA